ncbi:LysM peptidoglycan-binding domain-containing protein [Streptomyces laurentii]|uniref:LysM peptidoglycan-binding domain-containing protein n=1 Tax=Streptomyces laurentii TaxID=39478 RepID=UPI0036C87A92
MSTPVAVHKPGAPPPGKAPAAGGGGLAGMIKQKPAAAAAVGGVLLVVVLALFRRGGGDQSAAGLPADQLQMSGMGSMYDSTANDLYNSIQPQIDALARMMEQLQNKQPTPPTPGTPKPPTPPTPTKPPAPKPPAPKPPAKPTVAKPTYVTIKSGDTLSGIAKKAGITMAQLKKLNPTFWTNPKYKQGNMIWSGGKVRTK